MKTCCRALAVIVLLCAAGMASAETYPERPVRLIVPFPPGGTADVVARIVAAKLSENLGRQFYLENLPGGGSNTGTAAAARAKPDGYAILIGASNFMVNPLIFAQVRYDPISDFAPVTVLAVSPFVLVINPSVPAQSAPELIALVKAGSGKYSFASSGVGTTPHLLGELLKLSFNLDLVHVPFNGAAPAINSTLAGTTPIYFATPTVAAPLVHEGKLRALAVTSKTRLQALPDVPTVAEVGLPGEGADTMFGALLPAGTAQEIIELLHREMTKVIAAPQVKQRFAELGLEPVGNTPEEFRIYIQAEVARWGKVIRDANIRKE